jgi:hypothetical protein
MEPQRVVEARRLDLAAMEAEAVRLDRGREQLEVAGVGEHRAMDRLVVGQLGDRAEPAMRQRRALVRRLPVARLDRADVDRPGRSMSWRSGPSGIVAANRLRMAASGSRSSGGGTSGMVRELVREPFLRLLERCDQVEDRLALLAGDDPPVGKAAPVEVALDAEFDGSSSVPPRRK